MLVLEHTLPAVLIGLAVIAALVVGAYSFWRFLPRSLGTWTVGGLYILVIALLAWCLLIPGCKTTETHTLKPRFVIALDTSKSMLLKPKEDIPDRWSKAQQCQSVHQ